VSYLPEIFERAVEANRSRIALIEEDKQWTFGELSDEVDRMAAVLRERVKGDTVGILHLN
jgi:acyl-coenzyme A synthetase/AMP-(fatty) acid ligase